MMTTLVVAILAGTTAASWIHNPENDHWYRATQPGTWASAEDESMAFGGRLAAVQDPAEQAWLTQQFPFPENFWIGLVQDLDDPTCTPSCEPDGGWRWLTGESLAYANWAGGEPNDNHPDSEEVGIMNAFSPGLWADFPEVASIPLRGIVEAACLPECWVQNSTNGHWYRPTCPGTWQSASDEAAGIGAHLTIIDDAAEQAWLTDRFPAPENFWIGLVQDLNDSTCAPDCEPAGGWGWMNGTELGYTNWAGGEPNNNHPDSEEVGIMNAFSPGLWADFPDVASLPIRGIIELSATELTDCNANGIPDQCDIGSGTSLDCNNNGVPDECDLIVTVVFQQGSSYHGTVDTTLRSQDPDAPFGASDQVFVDKSPLMHGLIRFDGIIGTAAGQVPLGSAIIDAKLRLELTNPGDISTKLHSMRQPWSHDDTWNEWGGGIQPDGTEADVEPDAVIPIADVACFDCDPAANVTSSVQAWSDGEFNFGWVFLPGQEHDNGWVFASADHPQENLHPSLTITFVRDCNGNNIPDDCDLAEHDCNLNGLPDECDIADATSQDCQSDGIPDECQTAVNDCDTNGVPDDCQPDCDGDGLIDACDPDMDDDGVLNELDECDNTPLGTLVDPAGHPLGDINRDCATDLLDYNVLQQGFTGLLTPC